MITILLSLSRHATRCAEVRTASIHAGSPMTAVVAVSRPATRCAEVRTASIHAGSPMTAVIAVSRPLMREELRWAHAVAGSAVTQTIAFYRLPTQYASVAWVSKRKTYETATVRFRNDYKNFITSQIVYRYDWRTIDGTVFRYRHRSLVQGGWRIIAKNLETEQVIELGFIKVDAENPALEDVFLPDGEYEISVLTSSLFWKDAADTSVRTVVVGADTELSPLPTIYNLRSSVSFGTRTIQWSAAKSELADCLFGVWYSSESPVDTDRTPDATVWYSASMTEYQTSFAQHAPAYVAVAALRIGEETQIGKVHQLYLDWSNIPPRAPDDVMVLAEPLPVVDIDVSKKPAEEMDLALVF